MAAKAKAHILPWVDNILSRMIFYFRYSSWVRPPPPPPALGSGHVRPWSSLSPVPSCALAPRRRPRQDETLKQSFLAAILMLVGAISRNEGAHSYEFSQLPELFECLMVRAGPGAEAEAGGRPPPQDPRRPQEAPAGNGGGWTPRAGMSSSLAFAPGSTRTSPLPGDLTPRRAPLTRPSSAH